MKNSNHASKALAVVLSGALAFAPAANAALDDSNMAYTAASEGFYGSLRVQYANNEKGGKSNDSSVDADLSRLGVGGTADLGSGLEAFYGFEWNLGQPANGDTGLNTRQNHVGLRGDWGSVFLGAFDSVIVRFGGFATTDILDQYSGNFEPIYRTERAIAYVSPDLNGFQFGIEVAAQDGDSSTLDIPSDDTVTFTNSAGPIPCPVSSLALGGVNPSLGINEDGGCTEGNAKVVKSGDDGNDFDKIGFGASYSIQGLTFSGAYYQEQDTLGKGFRYEDDDDNVSYESLGDNSQYALGLSYGQDNWIVAAMYGSKNTSVPTSCLAKVSVDEAGTETGSNSCVAYKGDGTTVERDGRVYGEGDAPFFSIAAGVSIDKLDIHGLWEQQTSEDAFIDDSDIVSGANGVTSESTTRTDKVVLTTKDKEQTITAITARYHLGSKASLRAAWKNTETDMANGKTEDNTNYALGMRVDF